MTENIKNAYDETPYQSYPYAQSSPEKLATLGTLFGMNPPKIETATVLELGCAEGGNIIPHAVHYPKGKYVGVDLSKVQIDAGQKHIKEMGLKNIELKHLSITDIDESFGKFDYIICHGVLSWVPDFVQAKIFEIAKKNLNKNGIAYISYNTLPGWNMVRTVRDMMLYHSKEFANQDKVTQSRALLEFVKESLEGSEAPYAKVLKQEADLLSNQGDHYLRHDHLEDDNKQFYFNEFMAKANEQGLQYLSDCSLASMYVGNMKESVSTKLQEINDIVRTEQYMDFITNRRFRSTLLCHSDVQLNRALDNDSARKFALTFDITADKELKDAVIENNEPMKFYFKGDKEQFITTNSPALKAVFYVLIENKGYPISFANIIEKADKLISVDAKAAIEAELLKNVMNLVIKGYMEIHIQERDKAKIKLDKPNVNKLVKHQIEKTDNNWVTNQAHAPISVNFFDKFAIKHMNGKNSKEQILEQLVTEAKNGQLTLNEGDKKIEDPAQIKAALSAHLDNTIARLSAQSVFE
jgi:methyltransferase-like protein/cyclopropane fatty-acyl-phospholipid synthase-like methyltransferase